MVSERQDHAAGTRELTPRAIEKVTQMLFDAYGEKRVRYTRSKQEGKGLEERLENIEICCKDVSLIKIFDVDNSDDFDLAILAAILKCVLTLTIITFKQERLQRAARVRSTSCGWRSSGTGQTSPPRSCSPKTSIYRRHSSKKYCITKYESFLMSMVYNI